MATITFAGVPLLLEDPGFEFQVWLERTLSLEGLTIFGGGGTSELVEGRQRPRDGEVGLPVHNYTSYEPPEWRINTLWWPTGATRHAIGLFLASGSQLDKINEELGSDTSEATNSATLVIQEGSEAATEVSTTMTLLPAYKVTHPFVGKDTSPSDPTRPEDCWLLCLVDERYLWKFKSIGDIAVDKDSTWTGTFSAMGSGLGVSINHDTVSADYGRPDEVELLRKYDNAALLLEAVSASVGQRFVRRTDGSLLSMDADASKNRHETNAGIAEPTGAQKSKAAAGPDQLLGGGEHDEFQPDSVEVIFRKSIDGKAMDPDDPLFLEEVSPSTLGFDSGTADTVKTFHTTAFAEVDTGDATEATNASDVTDLATAIAGSYLGWLEKHYDYSYSGIKTWSMTGFDDWVWWHIGYQHSPQHSQLQRRLTDQTRDLPVPIRNQDYATFTRVRSQPFDFGVTSQLQQIGDRPPKPSGGKVTIEYGRVVERVVRPAMIDDPNFVQPAPPDPPVTPTQIPNPDVWMDGLPEKVIKAEDAPAVSTTSPPPGPAWMFDTPPGIAQVGFPVIFGEVSVVVYEKVPLPTLEEFLGHPPDPANTPTDVFPSWWPPPWPDRHWEKIETMKEGDVIPANPEGIATGTIPASDPRIGKPHPHLINNPNWTGPPDPDANGEFQFIENEARFIKEYWTNPNLVCLMTNMWVTGINKEIITASPTTFRSSEIRGNLGPHPLPP